MNYIMILEDDEELAFGMEMALKDKDFYLYRMQHSQRRGGSLKKPDL